MITESYALIFLQVLFYKTLQYSIALHLPERPKSSRKEKKRPLIQFYLKCGISSPKGVIQLIFLYVLCDFGNPRKC